MVWTCRLRQSSFQNCDHFLSQSLQFAGINYVKIGKNVANYLSLSITRSVLKFSKIYITSKLPFSGKWSDNIVQSKACQKVLPFWLTHWALVMIICIIELDHQVFRKWLVIHLVSSHYLNQSWLIISWIPRNTIQWNVNQNMYIVFPEYAFKYVCKIFAILFRALLVNGEMIS